MKVALFYDYGNNVGLGHYMRIEAISQVIRNDWSKNITYLFWACDQTESPNQFQWEKFKYAVVDSYVLKPKFYQAIEESPAELIIIDDSNINHKNEYESTNIYPHIWGDREYIPLRKSFWSIDKPKVKNTIRNVLVMFGGTERARDYSQFLHPLLDNYNVRCLTPTDRNVFTEEQIVSSMLWADVAISGCGVTLNELACVGVPTIGVLINDNQQYNGIAYANLGFLPYYLTEKTELRMIPKYLQSDALSHKKRKRLVTLGRELVDGQGAKRFVEKVLI